MRRRIGRQGNKLKLSPRCGCGEVGRANEKGDGDGALDARLAAGRTEAEVEVEEDIAAGLYRNELILRNARRPNMKKIKNKDEGMEKIQVVDCFCPFSSFT